MMLYLIPPKHQPDYVYLRHVKLWRVHLFTLVQLTCLVLLWLIKTSKASIVFPLMVRHNAHKDVTMPEFNCFK